MPISNATVRRRLRKYAQLFADQNCQYDGYENQACLDLLRSVGPVWEQGEEYNKKIPDHGRPWPDGKEPEPVKIDK